MRSLFWGGALLLSALTRLSVGAVQVTGKVSDETGVAVPGARLELRSAGGKPFTAVTDVAGLFSISVAEPGRYFVRCEREGFFRYQGESTLAPEGSHLSVILNHLEDLVQKVDVVYSAPELDPQQTSEKKQLNSIQILEVPYPASQDVRNAMPMIHGVLQDTGGRLHFNGGAADQANFALDGFNITDPVTGRLEARLNVESVRAVEYEGSGFPADKGRGSAGFVDLKTAMGDDHWRVGASTFVPSFSTASGLHWNKWTPRFQFSGPLKKGRIWFHNGFDAFYDVDTIVELPPDQNRSRALSSSNLTRVQANLTSANILTASLLLNIVSDSRRGLSFLDPVETTINRRNNYLFGSIKDQHTFHRGAVIEFGFAATSLFARENPQGNRTFEFLPSGRRGNYFLDLTRDVDRQQWVAKSYLPSVRSSFGTHQIQFGVDMQRTVFHQRADRHTYRILRQDESVARVVTFAGLGVAERRNFEFTEYVNDRWSPRQDLLIDAGLRLDWDQVVRDPLISPRLAASYVPAWLGGTKLSASAGIFHDALNLALISRHQDQVALSTFYAPNGSVARGPLETAFEVNERLLRVPRYRTISFSVERPLAFGLLGKASYVRRGGNRGLSFFGGPGLPDGSGFVQDSDTYLLRNWRRDRYDAVELTVRRTFAGTFHWQAGYTRSSARSNAVVDFSLENPIFADQTGGPFPWDSPHRWLSWGWAPLPVGLLTPRLRFLTRETSVSYLAEYRTGFPFSVVNEESFLLGRPNEQRLPGYFNINLHFERRFRFWHYLLAWRVGVNNLTNNGNPNVVNNNIDSPAFLAYGRGQQRAVQVRLRFLGRR
ncbi:MAG: carboxypeptidase regulatory-like domain-containing protein [Bryobacteraceae bacterium]